MEKIMVFNKDRINHSDHAIFKKHSLLNDRTLTHRLL